MALGRISLLAACCLAPIYTAGAQGEVAIGKPVPDFDNRPGASPAKRPRSIAVIQVPETRLLKPISERLSMFSNEPALTTRGAKESAVYRQASPAVVLIVTEKGFGSGALISASGDIVTNWHVVGDSDKVGVVFKPAQEGAEPAETDVRIAEVVRTDQVADLALVRVKDLPAGIAPLKLGATSSLPVGADVHAIGHPTGEAWTYTRGIVSQIRRGYSWVSRDGVRHSADVIQTQTPINPGNSGGPLLDDQLSVVGINSFKGEGEGLNFAVSAEEVRTLLTRTADRKAASAKTSAADCEPTALKTTRSESLPGQHELLDVDCDGVGDGIFSVPDDPTSPYSYSFDEDKDGTLDTMLIDEDRDGDFERSLHDTDGDGKSDVVAYYKDGEDDPYKVERMDS